MQGAVEGPQLTRGTTGEDGEKHESHHVLVPQTELVVTRNGSGNSDRHALDTDNAYGPHEGSQDYVKVEYLAAGVMTKVRPSLETGDKTEGS